MAELWNTWKLDIGDTCPDKFMKNCDKKKGGGDACLARELIDGTDGARLRSLKDSVDGCA